MPPSEIERLALEQLALRHVPGTGAVAIERVGSGLVNESYRVLRGGRPYSLRVPVPQAAELGLDRAWECRVLECAMAAGIAPIIEFCEPHRGILVARWAEGRTWTLEQAQRRENIEKIAHLARRVHALPIPRAAREMSPAAWIAYYHDALRRLGADATHSLGYGRWRTGLQAGLEARLAALAELPPPQAVLCHSDLHVQNLIAAERGLVLLDWEYAHVSEPSWDLAGWVGNNDLSAEYRRLLLANYLGRQPTAPEENRLQQLIWLYDYVCLLWSEVYLNLRRGAGDEGILARAQVLALRLRHEAGGRAGQVPAN